MERPHWATVDNFVEGREWAIGLLKARSSVGGPFHHQIVDISQRRIPCCRFRGGQPRFEPVDEQVDLAVVPVHRHFYAGNHDHATLSTDLDGAGNRALVVMISDRNDLETAIGNRVDQFVGLPKAIARKRMKVEIDGISGMKVMSECGQRCAILPRDTGTQWDKFS